LLGGNSDLSNVISLKSKSASGISAAVGQLRSAKYTHAIDFQGLYKSALLAFASGAPRRIGFQRSYAREGFASLSYTDGLNPRGAHKVDHNLTLAERAGSRIANAQFGETTYRRGASYSPAMLSITVEQVVEAVQRRLRLRS